LCQQTQRFVFEADLYSVARNARSYCRSKLPSEYFMMSNRSFASRVLTDDAYGQTPDEFRLEPILDEVLRGHVLEQFVIHHLNGAAPEPDLTVTDAPRHLFFQLLKTRADDEQNVPGVIVSRLLPRR